MDFAARFTAGFVNVAVVAHAGDAVNQFLAALVVMNASGTSVHQKALVISVGAGIGVIVIDHDHVIFKPDFSDESGFFFYVDDIDQSLAYWNLVNEMFS